MPRAAAHTHRHAAPALRPQRSAAARLLRHPTPVWVPRKRTDHAPMAVIRAPVTAAAAPFGVSGPHCVAPVLRLQTPPPPGAATRAQLCPPLSHTRTYYTRTHIHNIHSIQAYIQP